MITSIRQLSREAQPLAARAGLAVVAVVAALAIARLPLPLAAALVRANVGEQTATARTA